MPAKLIQLLYLTGLLLLWAPASHADSMSKGMDAYQAGNFEEAYRIWHPMAEKGDANAQFNIGLMYRNGNGLKQDDRQALIWFSKAAQQGMLDAQYNTGLMFYEGRGVAVSKHEALEWWKLASNKGHAPSQYNLAVLYAYGIATGKNIEKALELWRLSAQQGHEGSRKALYQAYMEGMFGLTADPEAAKQWQD